VLIRRLREEILETLGMAIYLGEGPLVMYAVYGMEAFGHLVPAKTETA